MRWRNTETPTFAGSAGSAKAPAIAETFELLDRDGSVVATFAKSVAGAITLAVTGDVSDGSGNTLASLLNAADVWNYKGATDCSANPNYPAASAGDLYKVSVAGKIGGASGTVVSVGDIFVCNTDNTLAGTEAQRGTAWDHFPAVSDIPVKASGAEVDTGTNDAKFVTPKAMEDSLYVKAAYVDAEDAQRIGNDAQYTKTTTGVQTLLGGNAVARAVIIGVEIDETFAAGDGAATLFSIGETGNPTKFVSGLNTGTALDRLTPYYGFLSANTALIITPTPATGTGTGGIHVTALALPEA